MFLGYASYAATPLDFGVCLVSLLNDQDATNGATNGAFGCYERGSWPLEKRIQIQLRRPGVLTPATRSGTTAGEPTAQGEPERTHAPGTEAPC